MIEWPSASATCAASSSTRTRRRDGVDVTCTLRGALVAAITAAAVAGVYYVEIEVLDQQEAIRRLQPPVVVRYSLLIPEAAALVKHDRLLIDDVHVEKRLDKRTHTSLCVS